MQVTHLQSSTTIIDVNGTRILSDPWLVDGEYFGSWYHYPKFKHPIAELEYDYIYVSHIHPDHLSKKTMAAMDKSKPVIIFNFEEKFLKRNIEALGFQVIEMDHGARFELPNGGFIAVYSADNCNPEICGRFFGCAPVESKFKVTQIDTLCVISDGEQVIMNTNDCPFDLAREVVDRVLGEFPEIDLLLVGYAGAGPFPQCFSFSDDTLKRAAADRKRDQFIGQAVKYINRIAPKAYMPFAGTYILGGRLAPLNDSRGVPLLGDALALLQARVEASSQGFLLNSGAVYDTKSQTCSAPYQEMVAQEVQAYINTLIDKPYDYDSEKPMLDDAIFDLVQKAYPRFKRKADGIEFASDTKIIVADTEGLRVCFSTQEPPVKIAGADIAALGKYVEITVDRRLLGLLLQGPRFAHWNNAEIGSHLKFRREPDVFERGLYYSLSSFHI